MQICASLVHEFSHAPARVFAEATSLEGLPKTFTGFGPIPGVLRAEVVGGGELKEGATRRVYNSDGSAIDEVIEALRAPERHAYRLVRGFKPPFNLLVREALSDWRFSPSAKGTRLEWSYTFTLTSPLAFPVTAPLVKVFFAQAMRRCVKNIEALL